MGSDGPGDLGINVRCDHLLAPIAVISAYEPTDRYVVQQAGRNGFFIMSCQTGETGALKEMVRVDKPLTEEVQKARPLGHFGEPGVVPHDDHWLLVGKLVETGSVVYGHETFSLRGDEGMLLGYIGAERQYVRQRAGKAVDKMYGSGQAAFPGIKSSCSQIVEEGEGLC